MKFISDPNDTDLGLPTIELTQRNLETLLAKLKDPLSMRTLVDGTGAMAVKAVPDEEHYTDRAPGEVYMPETDTHHQESIITISTPQPEYVNQTQEAVESALDPELTDNGNTEHFKLVPTPADWMSAWQKNGQIECPLCATWVSSTSIDTHTAWHQKLLDIVLLLAR